MLTHRPPKVFVSLATTHLLTYLKLHLWKQDNVSTTSCHTRPTLLILLQAIFSYSHRWKLHWRVGDLMTLMKSFKRWNIGFQCNLRISSMMTCVVWSIGGRNMYTTLDGDYVEKSWSADFEDLRVLKRTLRFSKSADQGLSEILNLMTSTTAVCGESV